MLDTGYSITWAALSVVPADIEHPATSIEYQPVKVRFFLNHLYISDPVIQTSEFLS
jgi:hypothetical protein